MSVRYSLSVIPNSRFTTRIYQARHILCGQYGCWAAEMQPVHLPLVDFFSCPEDQAAAVAAELPAAAESFLRRHYYVSLPSWDLAAGAGQIYLDFNSGIIFRRPPEWPVNRLRQELRERLERIDGLPPLPEIDPEMPPLRLPLMQYANLPEPVFDGAAALAKEILRDLLLPTTARLGQLVMLRFESAAAGENWSEGRWASDLRFQWVSAHPLN